MTPTFFRNQLIDRFTEPLIPERRRLQLQSKMGRRKTPGTEGTRNLNFCKLCPSPCLTTGGEVESHGIMELPLRVVVRLLGRVARLRNGLPLPICPIIAMRQRPKCEAIFGAEQQYCNGNLSNEQDLRTFTTRFVPKL